MEAKSSSNSQVGDDLPDPDVKIILLGDSAVGKVSCLSFCGASFWSVFILFHFV